MKAVLADSLGEHFVSNDCMSGTLPDVGKLGVCKQIVTVQGVVGAQRRCWLFLGGQWGPGKASWKRRHLTLTSRGPRHSVRRSSGAL